METTPRYPQDDTRRTQQGSDEVQHMESAARENLARVNDKVLQFLRERPIVALAAAVGVGFVVARLFGRKRW